MALTITSQLLNRLVDAGVIDTAEGIQRIIIDAQFDCAVRVYVQRVGDDRLADVLLNAGLQFDGQEKGESDG